MSYMYMHVTCVCIRRYGPLVRHWTMRYEAKHNHLKKLAQNIGNFINIALTLASRHQYWQCYKWQEGDVMDDEPEIGPGNVIYNVMYCSGLIISTTM